MSKTHRPGTLGHIRFANGELSKVSYEILNAELISHGAQMYRIQCVETGVITFTSHDAFAPVKVQGMNLTLDEYRELCEALTRAAHSQSRFIRFLSDQPISELTNKWYAGAADVREEIHSAFAWILDMWAAQS